MHHDVVTTLCGAISIKLLLLMLGISPLQSSNAMPDCLRICSGTLPATRRHFDGNYAHDSTFTRRQSCARKVSAGSGFLCMGFAVQSLTNSGCNKVLVLYITTVVRQLEH